MQWSRWKHSSLSRRGTMSLMMGDVNCVTRVRLEETDLLAEATKYVDVAMESLRVKVPCT